MMINGAAMKNNTSQKGEMIHREDADEALGETIEKFYSIVNDRNSV